MMIKTENIVYRYEDGTIALNKVSVDFSMYNIIGILGCNGSGKTTLFLNLCGILKPEEGRILFNGEELKYNKKSLLKLRKSIGIVFQDPDKQIFHSKVYDDVAFGPRNMGFSEEVVEERVAKAMSLVGIDGLKDKPVHFLSYGQKKRVAIAGVLAMDNDIICFDEPTAGLDPKMTRTMIKMIRDIAAQGKKIIISSHDMDLIYNICEYTYILNKGVIFKEGNVNNIFLDEEVLVQIGLEQPWLVRLHCKTKIPLFSGEEELYNYLNKLL
ncbi:cobalt/nickel transport system ATP-binding protein [Proteiniborus sp. DW1]|nr:cobalt/nickel transport system ATP-binding protein [Proteiniborus sp. DW1]